MDKLYEPIKYQLDKSGKGIREKLVDELCEYYECQGISEDLKLLVTTIHECGICIDDIEDATMYRRGYPTSVNIYGINKTLNSALLYLFTSLKTVLKHRPTWTLHIIDTLENIMIGQSLDINWKEDWKLNHTLPSYEQYIGMIRYKTGILFEIIVDIIHVETGKIMDSIKKEMIQLGIIYQMYDDFVNAFDSNYCLNKGGTFTDILEGNTSLLIILSNIDLHQYIGCESEEKRKELVDVLVQQGVKDTAKRLILDKIFLLCECKIIPCINSLLVGILKCLE